MKSVFKFILAVLAIFFSSCNKEKNYPEIPYIEYKSFAYNPSNGEGYLNIGFQDGDGDIGLYSWQNDPPFDTGSIYHYNYYINVFEKINGFYTPLKIFNNNTQQYDTIVFKYRIPYIEPISANGSVKGEFHTKIDLGLMIPFLHSDTVKFDMYIYDRKLHKSNVASTPDLLFN